MEHQLMNHKLKIVVRIDSNLERARIEVLGTVTLRNLRALYVITRRTNALLPGREVIVDLGRARAERDAMSNLHDAARDRCLPREADPANTPCRLRILDPVDDLVAA